MSATPRRGRPPRTSRAAILDAVLAVGLDRATTSVVAEHLGVDQSSLYRYVSSRDDMLDAAVELAVQRATWPDPQDDWAEYLRDCARAMWAMFAATPGLAQRLRSMGTVPAQLVVQTYLVIRQLTTLGFDFREAALIVDTIGDLTADSYLTIESLDRVVGDGISYREQALRTMAAAGSAVPDAGDAEAYLEAMRFAMGEQGAPSSWWLDKVDLVIDGVARRIEGRG